MLAKRFVLLLVLGLAACAAEGTDADPTRGPLGKADGVGSCVDSCGGKSDGTCWCDPGCVEYGDCCDDSFAACGIGEAPASASCVGHCGGQSADKSCWCDAGCVQYGDCCDDVAAACDATPPATCADAGGTCQAGASCAGGAAPLDGTCAAGQSCCPPATGGSCEGACGEKSADGCWCDDQCAQYGDCCEDLAEACPERTAIAGQCLKNADACESDADCAVGGCTDQLCYNPALSTGVTTCETCPEGTDPAPQGCGCIDGSCSWWN